MKCHRIAGFLGLLNAVIFILFEIARPLILSSDAQHETFQLFFDILSLVTDLILLSAFISLSCDVKNRLAGFFGIGAYTFLLASIVMRIIPGLSEMPWELVGAMGIFGCVLMAFAWCTLKLSIPKSVRIFLSVAVIYSTLCMISRMFMPHTVTITEDNQLLWSVLDLIIYDPFFGTIGTLLQMLIWGFLAFNVKVEDLRMTFVGRARRSAYLSFFGAALFVILNSVYFMVAQIDLYDAPRDILLMGVARVVAYAVVIVFVFVLSVPLTVRRLHDRSLSGHWVWRIMLLRLIPIVGTIADCWLFVNLCCQDSVPGENAYGPNPKEIVRRK